MTGHHGTRRKVPPHQPIYSDQRVLGVKLSTRIKAILVLIVVIAFLVVAKLLNSADIANARHEQAQSDRAAQEQQIASNAAAIQAAFEDTRELACALIAQFPPTLTTPVDVPAVRLKYQCPPYGTSPLSPLPTFVPLPTASATPTASPDPTRTTTPRSTPRSSTAISEPSVVPKLTPTPSAAASSRSAGPLAPVLTPVCTLLAPLVC